MLEADQSDERPGASGAQRLQKVMARAGVASRRVCEDMIADGRVTIDGTVATLGDRVDPSCQAVTLDGAPLPLAPGLEHHLVNKPAGVLSAASDDRGRPVVVDLVDTSARVFPVGRLDADTEGLIICTNDGELAHRLTHPSFGVDKEYLAEVDGSPSRAALRRLREGVELDDGVTAPAKASEVSSGVIKLVIHEGRNRQVRRMCEAIGHPVRRLVRVRIGPVADRQLAPGATRPLTFGEVSALYAESSPAEADTAGYDPGP